MKWSPAIAGRRGRCRCGATVQVPNAIEPPAEAEDDLLSALEKPIRPVVEPDAYVNLPRAPTLAYERPAPRPETFGESKDLVREIYVPVGVVILGYAGTLAWVGYHGGLVFAAVATTVIVLATVLMVIKTAVLSAFAWYLSRQSGGSFGHPVGTIVKIAGLVVALDAATLWAISAMVALGAITPRGGFYPVKTLVVLFLATLVVAALIAQLVYGLHGDEANFFSRFMAGGNLCINVVLVIVLTVVAHNAATARRQAQARAAASAAQTLNTTPQASSTSSPSSIVAETDADRAIKLRLSKNNPFITDLQEWKTSLAFRKSDVPLDRFLERVYVAGATKVYIDTSGGGFTRAYVDLPGDRQHRDACFDIVTDARAQNRNMVVKPIPPTTARFLEIDVRR